VQAAMESAGVPCLVAGADLGPASDLRGARHGRPRRGADEDGDAEEVNRDAVVLTTFHRSKGLQWHTVMIIGLSEGLMPIASARTPAAIEEERRLFYVALTRAEEELWCSWSAGEGSTSASGSPRSRGPSPWLAAVERTIARLTQAAAPTASSEVSARVAELRRRLDSGADSANQ
jgi:DNA helicase-2/ATP-dependent DNA helicase PcrA